MITIKKIHLSEFHNLIIYDELNMSFENNLDNHHSNVEYFVVLDGAEVLGHAAIDALPNISTALIKEIFILPNARKQGLGDGLLRTVLNYLHNSLFNKAIIKGNEKLHAFLINEGIEEIDFKNLEEEIKDVLLKEGHYTYYTCNMEEFFNRGCKGIELK